MKPKFTIKDIYPNVDNDADEMHEIVVKELIKKLTDTSQPVEKPETCEWKRDPICRYFYDTECGENIPLDETPSETGWIYCPRCGRRIEVVE